MCIHKHNMYIVVFTSLVIPIYLHMNPLSTSSPASPVGHRRILRLLKGSEPKECNALAQEDKWTPSLGGIN